MKFLRFFLLLFSLLWMSQASATAYNEYNVDGIIYKISSYADKEVCVTFDSDLTEKDPNGGIGNYTGNTYTGVVNIPEEVSIDGTLYTVTSVDDYAFKNSDGLIAVNLPNTIKKLGAAAFYGNPSLTSMVLPSSLKEIGAECFRDCKNLASINFPEGLEKIYFDAFTHDWALTEVILPSSLKYLDCYAFCDCKGVKKVILADSEQALEQPRNFNGQCIFDQMSVDYAYIGRNIIGSEIKIDTKELVLGNAITYISDSMFNPATLEKITIPPSVITVKKEAFKNALALKDVIIQDGDSPIYFMGSVYTTSTGNGTSSTYHYCFQNTPLEHVYIGRNFNPDYNSGYKTEYDAIGSAFSYAKSLRSVEFGSNVTRLFQYSFLRCESLETLDFSHSQIGQIDDGCFSDCYELTSVVLPQMLKSIKYRAFDSCIKLTSITLPDNLSEIGELAFAYCNLEVLSVPGTVKTIGKSAFSDNKNLSYLTLGNGIETISEYAFSNCASLTELSIPSSVTLLKYDSFAGLTSLKKICFEDGSAEINTEYSDSYGASYGKKCKHVFTQSTKNLTEVYVGRDFSFDHFSGNNQYVHDYSEFFYSWDYSDMESNPVVTFGPLVTSSPKNMFKSLSRINKVICLGTSTIPYYYDSFYNSRVNLYVPVGYVDKYVNDYFWRDFASVQENIRANRVELDVNYLILAEGETARLIATVFPLNATNADVEWRSSDLSVASVENGLVLAHSAGEAIISVKLADGSGRGDYCHIVVDSSTVVNETDIESGCVYVIDRTIHADNASGKVLRVVQCNGTQTYYDDSDEPTKEYTLSAPGMYIVIVGTESYKFILK